jgi:nucleoside-diphosphate-sugar epimerase
MSSSVIDSEERLESALSEPWEGVIELFGRLDGDIILLGVGGKMGPTLARMARRAADAAGGKRRVIGVSRFSSGGRDALHAHGVETIACDLLSEEQVTGLPEAPNVVFMAGRKFGSTGDEATTWASNCAVPASVCRRYHNSRILAFSTGNVYGLVPVEGGGSREDDVPRPVGEYAMSGLGRERVFEYFSRQLEIPITLARLNYACELRYGVVVDLARKVWAEEPIDLSMGYFNTIWQGDANAHALLALEYARVPPFVVNLTGPERLSVRETCERLGVLLKKRARFTGTESDTALLSDARPALDLLGPPRVSAEELIEWVADWVARGGRNLDKPTHFESRDGLF